MGTVDSNFSFARGAWDVGVRIGPELGRRWHCCAAVWGLLHSSMRQKKYAVGSLQPDLGVLFELLREALLHLSLIHI